MWGTVLSDPLAIVALVGRRPANQLMARMPVPVRVAALPPWGCPPGVHAVLSGVSTGYPADRGWLHTRYAPVRHSRGPEGPLTVRLACIRPAASVHPEPGSNSSLYYCLASCFSLNLGFRLPPPRSRAVASFLFLILPASLPGCRLCWPQTFKDRSFPSLMFHSHYSCRKRIAKVQPFFESAIN